MHCATHRRVCVLDFDVHHGNGTQDILCKTYDPRFLYISMHAGAKQAKPDGYNSNSDDEEIEEGEGGKKRGKDDIFPGKCGNTSPHKGVLNIPMGNKVSDLCINDLRSSTSNLLRTGHRCAGRARHAGHNQHDH